ncbi:MAG: TVP38/TMEM64 family protein [Proteobacteria bacterium]|nr:TVP38/TMEM64 family protein [Desulfobulbaceae bacterium]MBU4153079.1 TVP38/TMEM64 family protein [Pseudomonadota bacterium]
MTKGRGRAVLLLAGAFAVVALFVYFDLGQYLTLDYLKGSQATLQGWYADRPILVLAIYMGVYVVVTALSLPGAVVLGLAAGGLFGFWVGIVAVSFASTIGATVACYVARILLQGWVQNRFAGALVTINQGMAQEGAFYLFTLRLIPVVPFFVINLVMGVTKIPLTTFYWVSQIGMLAGTMVYVNAGKELAKIETLAGIVSPRMIVSFVLLGILPITAKKVVSWYRARV